MYPIFWLRSILLSTADSPAGEFRAHTKLPKKQLLFTWCPFFTQKDAKRSLPAVFSQEPGPWALISDGLCRGASSPLQQKARILPDELSSARTSAFHQKVLAQEICGRPFSSTRAASGMRKGFRIVQRSSRRQINVQLGRVATS